MGWGGGGGRVKLSNTDKEGSLKTKNIELKKFPVSENLTLNFMDHACWRMGQCPRASWEYGGDCPHTSWEYGGECPH